MDYSNETTFSLYRNMPLVMQMWNAFRGRALAVEPLEDVHFWISFVLG